MRRANGTILVDDVGLTFARKGWHKFAIPFADMLSVRAASTVDIYGKTFNNTVATPWGLQAVYEPKVFVVVSCTVAGVAHDARFAMIGRGLWAVDNAVQAAKEVEAAWRLHCPHTD